MKSKPIIIVTGPDKGGSTAWIFTALNVLIAGGRPQRAQPKNFTSIKKFDGLILGGGSNIHSLNTKRKKLEKVNRSFFLKLKEAVLYPLEFLTNLFGSSSYDLPRDMMEIEYLEHSINNNLPVLGICRGLQLISSRLGGQLYESTLPYYKTKPRIRSLFPRKKIYIQNTDSLLFKIFKSKEAYVNAIHSQAVSKPPENFGVVAVERAGIYQAIENPHQNIIAVQWHPEYLLYLQKQRSLFNWLIGVAKNEKK